MFFAIVTKTEHIELIRQLFLIMPEASTLRNHINAIKQTHMLQMIEE